MNLEWGPDVLIPFLVRLKAFGGPEFRIGNLNFLFGLHMINIINNAQNYLFLSNFWIWTVLSRIKMMTHLNLVRNYRECSQSLFLKNLE